MADRLKIYACSGIGDAEKGSTGMYEYWMDNTKSITNTQAVNSLLIGINYAWVRAARLKGLTNEQRIEELCKVDFYTVCLDAARRFANQPDMLHKAGAVIYGMVNGGDFNYSSLDGDKRDEHLDSLLAKAELGYDSDVDQNMDKTFSKWWKENIEDLNKVGLDAEQREKVSEVVSGIAATTNLPNDPVELLNNAGKYFLYTYMTDKQLAKLSAKYRVKVEDKRSYQRRIYNYNLSLLVAQCGSKAKVNEIIRTNIINEFQKTPEELCDDIVGGKAVSGIGSVSVLAVIAAVGSLLIEIVKLIVNKTAASDSASSNYQKPTTTDITNGLPGVYDVSTGGGSGWTKYLPLVAAAGLITYVLYD